LLSVLGFSVCVTVGWIVAEPGGEGESSFERWPEHPCRKTTTKVLGFPQPLSAWTGLFFFFSIGPQHGPFPACLLSLPRGACFGFCFFFVQQIAAFVFMPFWCNKRLQCAPRKAPPLSEFPPFCLPFPGATFSIFFFRYDSPWSSHAVYFR